MPYYEVYSTYPKIDGRLGPLLLNEEVFAEILHPLLHRALGDAFSC